MKRKISKLVNKTAGNDSSLTKKQNDIKLQKSLDNYSAWLIKVVGVIGIILGFVILGAFWYWLIKLLFKLGA